MNQELRDLLQKIADNREDSVFITDAEATVARNALEPPVQWIDPKRTEPQCIHGNIPLLCSKCPEPASREALPEHVHSWDGDQCHYCHIPRSAVKSAAVVLQIEDGFTKLDGYLGKIYTCSVHGRSETQCDHWPVAKSTEGHK